MTAAIEDAVRSPVRVPEQDDARDELIGEKTARRFGKSPATASSAATLATNQTSGQIAYASVAAIAARKVR